MFLRLRNDDMHIDSIGCQVNENNLLWQVKLVQLKSLQLKS